MEKWDPRRDIFSLRERMNKLFEDASCRAERVDCASWLPVVDICETEEGFVVTAELPEVRERDISIGVEGHILRISGERRLHREGKSYHQVERHYGAFSRSFMLPSELDAGGMERSLKDGILKLVLPRKTEELPARIEIK